MSKKILCLGDIHQEQRALLLLEGFLKKNRPDSLIFTGDLTNRNEKALAYARNFLKIASSYTELLFCIHGNNDSPEVIDLFKEKKCFIHLEAKELFGYKIIGIGGFGEEWSPKLNLQTKDSIFVTHYPPKRVKLNVKNKPKIHISGHIHNKEYAEKKDGILFISVPSIINYHRVAILSLPEERAEFTSL